MSCEAKKKQHEYASLGLSDQYSELFTQMVARNFLNAVTKSYYFEILTQHILPR